MIENINTPRSRLERGREFLITSFEFLRHVPGRVLDLRVRLILIRGKIPGSDETAVMLYAGRGHNLAYLKGKALRDAEVVSSKTVSLLSYRGALKTLEAEADFVFVDIGRPYQGPLIKDGGYLVLPDWINVIIPLRGDWNSIESRFNKTTRKLIRKNPYRFEISRDPEVIRGFYDEFYLPYVKLRHEDATIEPRSAILRRARQGGILQVIGEDGPVVAGVVYPQDGILYYLWLGMAERYLDNQPEGALFASYYFCLRYAHQKAFRAANWMGTRSFPNDGVFQFKRKWGAHIEDSFSADSVLFKPAANNRKAIAFAKSFPMIARRGAGLEQILCVTEPSPTDADLGRLVSAQSCGGLDQVTIVHVTEDAGAPVSKPLKENPDVRVIRVDARRFRDVYARDFHLGDAPRQAVALPGD